MRLYRSSKKGRTEGVSKRASLNSKREIAPRSPSIPDAGTLSRDSFTIALTSHPSPFLSPSLTPHLLHPPCRVNSLLEVTSSQITLLQAR